MDQSKELATAPVGKLLFKLALPAIVAQIINVLYNIVDRIYIGHLPEIGADALTGVGVTMPVILCISAFAALVSMGAAPRASIMMGRNDYDQAEKILGNSTVMLVIISIILTLVISFFGYDILMVFGASENTITYAWEYMRIYALGTIFVQFALGLNAFITAQGYSTISMLTVLIGAIINIILDPIFMFVFDMGVSGAAWATITSQAISAIWVVYFLVSKRSTLRIKRKNLNLDPSISISSLSLGMGPFVMQFTESVIITCFNTSLLKYGGDIAVGSMTILSSIMQFAMLPLSGMTQGSQPIVSFNYGAKNYDRVKKTFRYLLISCLVYSVTLWALCMLFPQMFARMFTPSVELQEYTKWTMRVYMAGLFIFVAQIACQQRFMALGNAKMSLFLALLRKVILLIPLIYILPMILPNQTFAVFLAEPIADIIAVCTTCTLFYRTYKKIGVVN